MATLNTHMPDECCGGLIGDAMLVDALADAGSWTCPMCGQEWRVREHQGSDCTFRHWEPYVFAVMIR